MTAQRSCIIPGTRWWQECRGRTLEFPPRLTGLEQPTDTISQMIDEPARPCTPAVPSTGRDPVCQSGTAEATGKHVVSLLVVRRWLYQAGFVPVDSSALRSLSRRVHPASNES